jgi:hypothetical protein
MADETGTAPVVALASLDGWLLAITDADPKAWARVDAAEIAAAAAAAATALQPENVGSAAGLDIEEVQAMIDASFAGIDTLLGELLG